MLLKIIIIFSAINTTINHENPFNEDCGYHAAFYKIFNGEFTAIDEFPWIALLKYKKREGKSVGFGCSGTLITTQHILTTAHCIKDWRKRGLELFSVRLGEYNISSEIDCVEIWDLKDCADPPQDIYVDSWIVHPQYHNHIHDIAVIKLKNKAIITDFVRPICLPLPNNIIDVGEMLIVAGWGRTEKGNVSAIKLKVKVPLVSFYSCYQQYKVTNTILNYSQHLCAGSVLGRDSCTGDSGGPLMKTNKNSERWEIVGVISTGNSCGLKGWPAIYIRVDYYRNWIIAQIDKMLEL